MEQRQEDDAQRALAVVAASQRRSRAALHVQLRLTIVRAVLVAAALSAAALPDRGLGALVLLSCALLGAALLVALQTPRGAAVFGREGVLRSRSLRRGELLACLALGAAVPVVHRITMAAASGTGEPVVVAGVIVFGAIVAADLAWNRRLRRDAA
jgi:hypothetical protein